MKFHILVAKGKTIFSSNSRLDNQDNLQNAKGTSQHTCALSIIFLLGSPNYSTQGRLILKRLTNDLKKYFFLNNRLYKYKNERMKDIFIVDEDVQT